jgi:hypothetical protein
MKNLKADTIMNIKYVLQNPILYYFRYLAEERVGDKGRN